MPQVWFITGASSGFGRAVTEYALAQGAQVVATARKPEALADLTKTYDSSRLITPKLDVTVKPQIIEAFEAAKKAFGRIDVVYSNAGYIFVGEVETCSDEVARNLFEANFWAALWVGQEAVRFFRDVNPTPGGHLIQVTTFLGHAPVPCGGFYNASKIALEVLTETQSLELNSKWNIKTTIVQPGLYPTGIFREQTHVEPISPNYDTDDSPAKYMRSALDVVMQTGQTPAKYAVQVYRCAQLERPPLHLAIGKDAIAMMKKKAETMIKELDEYESWSDDLQA